MGLVSYRTLLAARAARGQLAGGLLAQVTQGAAPVGIILVVRQHTGSLVLAGGVVAATSIAAAVARPVQGGLIDRRGARRVTALCGIGHGLAIGGIVGLAHLHGAGAWLVLVGALAGLTLPPLSTSMRILWAGPPGEDRTAAYSLVYLTQELALLTGPLILALIIALSSASVALVALALITAAGSLVFAASSAPGPGRGRLAASGHERGSPSAGHERRSSAAVLRNPGMARLLPTAMLVGAALGGLEVGAPTVATAHHTPAAAGVLIALLSVGGILGAALYGSRAWRMPPARRLLVLLGVMTVALGLLVVDQSLWWVGALLLVLGLPLNPAITTFSLVVDDHVPPRAAGEAFGWLSTALATGTGAAAALAAAVARHHDPRAAFGVAAIAGLGATVFCLLSRRALERGTSVRG
jgi:MFS family permease